MAATTRDESPPAETPYRRFLVDRFASILALLPLGVWTFIHVWNNLSAFQGAEAWQTAVTGHAHPVAQLVTLFVVLAPLFLHTVWGIGRLFMSRPNNGSYPYFGNLRFILQRLSALGVLLFLGAHLWLAFLKPRLVEGAPEAFHHIAGEMHHHLPTLAVYLLGTLGVAYHLGNGLCSAAWGLGFVTSRTSQKRMETAGIVTFLILLAMCWSAIYALWLAGGSLPAPVN